MKVLYILHTIKTHGSNISFQKMIDGLVKDGVTPIIIFPYKKGNHDLIMNFKTKGFQCYSCPIVQTRSYPQIKISTYFFYFLLLFPKIISFFFILIIAIKTKPDIIHTNTGVVHEGYCVSKILRIPHVWHIREYQTKDFGWDILPSKQFFEKELFDSYGIFITKGLQSYFMHDKSKVIYNPIYSIDEINKLNPKKEKYFLIANRLSKEKGIEDIIRGFALFCQFNNEFKLYIAGTGEKAYISDIKQLCEKLKIVQKVIFLGHIADVRELIMNATILFVGSYYEAFGRMTAEANILGTFVIGRNTGGTKEILELTKGGVLFDNYKEIPTLITNYLNTDKRFMEEVHAIAKQNYSTQNHCKQIMQVYNNIRNLSTNTI